ncbi:CAP domain-containing protein [Thioclava sp. FR2]|uniref:CAP domain-containing protein n=1 Tax=Thioclava sp. FR2 TaxID=3445780 RepID=UPI003EBFBE53
MFSKSIVLASLLALSTTASFACTKPKQAAAMEAEMIGWINAQRKAKGLATLSKNGNLTKAAQQHACDMADRRYFAHQRAGGPDMGQRIKSNGYRYRTAAENIAKMGSPSVNSTAMIWKNSPGHWANILKSNVREIGIGLAVADGKYYWVMNVGRSK